MFDISKTPSIVQLLAFSRIACDWVYRRNPKNQEAKALRNEFYATIWKASAKQLGFEVSELGKGIFEFTKPDQTHFRVKNNYSTLDGNATLKRAGDKPLVHDILRQNRIPVPDCQTFTLKTLSRARQFLLESEVPCVVKPAAGTGAGQGITTGIQTGEQLGWAVARAARFHSQMVIEKQIPGDNFRLLFCNGVLLDIVKRCPPKVIGDGTSNIKKLIALENERRLSSWKIAQSILRIDQDLTQTLATQGLTLKSVPEAEVEIQIKTVVNDNSAEENKTAMNDFCDEAIRVCLDSADAIGVNLAGVDVITSDPTRPLEETGGVVLEVNTTPGLYVHKRGDNCPVAPIILMAMANQKSQLRHEQGNTDPLQAGWIK